MRRQGVLTIFGSQVGRVADIFVTVHQAQAQLHQKDCPGLLQQPNCVLLERVRLKAMTAKQCMHARSQRTVEGSSVARSHKS